jgi:group I intron endonuclease
LQTILWRYLNLMGSSQQIMRKLDNLIHLNSWLWIKKKHKKINKKDLYHKYFQNTKKSCDFNLIKSRYILSGVLTRGKHTIHKDYDSFPQDFFNIWKSLQISDHLLWSNIEINIQKIKNQLKNKSGIYIFWLTSNKQNCYVGSGVDLSRRIQTHYRNALINNKHPKFYNAVKKYGWSNFSLQILDLVPKSHLITREQYWLTLLRKSNSWKESYNLLEKANYWEGYSHTLESKIKISQSKKGKSLTPEHIKNISQGKMGLKHHLYGKKRNPAEGTCQRRLRCLKVPSVRWNYRKN